jgi:hypothetical protein
LPERNAIRVTTKPRRYPRAKAAKGTSANARTISAASGRRCPVCSSHKMSAASLAIPIAIQAMI